MASLEAIPEGELVDEDGAEDEALGVEQATGGHLPAAVEDPFELAVEVLDGARAKLMEDPADLDTAVGVRVSAAPRGDQFPVAGSAERPQGGVIVVGVAWVSPSR